MGAVWLRLRADLRARWRSWVGIALVAGIAGGLTTAAAAGARRTDTAYDRLVEYTRPPDVVVYNYQDEGLAVLDPEAVEALPQVAEATRVNIFFVEATPGGTAAAAPADERVGSSMYRNRIIEGRAARPDAAHEVTIGYAAAEAYGEESGFGVGSTIPMVPDEDDPHLLELPQDIRAKVIEEYRKIREHAENVGMPLMLEVVGVQAGSSDLPPITVGSSVFVYGTPALHEVLSRSDFDDSEVDTVLVRLRRGEADVDAFVEELEALAGDRGYVQPELQRSVAARTERAIGPLTTAMWLLAGLIGIAGTLVLGQAIARQVIFASDDDQILRAVGMSSGQLWLLAMTRALVAGALAAIVATAVAFLASPVAPLGIARIAEPSPGFRIDAMAFGVGAAATLTAFVILTALPARRAAGARARLAVTWTARTSTTGAILARTGAPIPIVAGAHLALTPGRGTRSVPVRTTLLGVAVAVAALAAALSIGASFDHLLRTPRLYGQVWDRFFTNYGESDFGEGIQAIKNDPGIAALSYGDGGQIALQGETIEILAITPVAGRLYPPIVEGREARNADEIVLGIRTLRSIRKHVGDTVAVSFLKQTRQMTVVGMAVVPAVTSGEFGEVAVLDYEKNRALLDQAQDGASVLIVRFDPDANWIEVLDRMEIALIPPDIRDFTDMNDFAIGGETPADVVNFGRVENLPLILSAALALLAAAVLAHMVASSVRRRRRDLAILKSLGLGRRQLRAAVGWQATLMILAALAIGVPAGIMGGRWAWTALADRVGVVPEPRVPAVATILMLPAAILLANLVAAIPGRIAARTQPALVLRAE